MNTKFRRHQKVELLRDANPDLVEYHDELGTKSVPIKKGMTGKINIILPNGKYHVEILNDKGEVIAYAPFSEDELIAID